MDIQLPLRGQHVNNAPFLKLLISPKLRLLRHTILILFMLLSLSNDNKEFVGNLDTIVDVAIFVLLLLILYCNMYVLMPRILFREKYTSYVLSVLAFIVGLCFFFIYLDQVLLRPYRIKPSELDQKNGFREILALCFIIGIFIAASTAVKLFQRWIIDSQRINELEKTTLKSELTHLKSQINPHFLFNMLNNANVLVKTDADKASQVLMRLSDLLRYQLYDSARNTVLLTSEIHFLTDFLNLEKVRRDHFGFLVLKEGDISGVQIPPFLFITFVENAVKHSADTEKASGIEISFKILHNKLRFTCVNTKAAEHPPATFKGGIGLTNVKRRLELLFQGKYELSIQDKADSYKVALVLYL
jgi:sensor histidine kinase YesM